MRTLIAATIALSLCSTLAAADPPPYRLELDAATTEVYIPLSAFVYPGSRVDSPVHFTWDAAANKLRVYANNSDNLPFSAAGFGAQTAVQSTVEAYPSNFHPSPTRFDYKGWVQTPYALPDGSHIAVVHNEYHGEDVEQHAAECALIVTPSTQKCWYVTGVVVRSTDGAQTWQRTGQLIGIPYRFSRDMVRAGIGGYRIIRHPNNGHLYMLLSGISQWQSQQRGLCLARSTDNGATWRSWQGSAFSGIFIDPYVTLDTPEKYICAPLNTPGIPSMAVSSLFFHQPSNLFFAVGTDVGDPVTRLCNRFFLITSSDLINWSEPEYFKQDCARQIHYPSFVEHVAAPNYDVSANNSIHLYWAQNSIGQEARVMREVYRIVSRSALLRPRR